MVQDKNPAFARSFCSNQRTSWIDTQLAVEDFGNNHTTAEKQDKFPANPRKTHVGILLSWTNGQFASLFEAVYTFCDLEVYPTIMFVLGEVVFIDEFL